MSDDVNSPEYWNTRFATNWVARGGRDQSRVFMDLALKNLPRTVYDEIARRSLSIIDAGCAEGDGTALLAETFAESCVSGFDFSTLAVDHARHNYPGVQFFVARFADLDRAASVIISSNCLEHMSDVMPVLRALASQSDRYLILLVPYAEAYPPDPEHRLQVHASTFPEAFDAWELTHRVLVPPSPVWAGYQLLLIYETPRPHRAPMLASLPDVAAVALALRALRPEAELEEFRKPRIAPLLMPAGPADETAALKRQLGEAALYVGKVLAEREAAVASRNAALDMKDCELAAARSESAAARSLLREREAEGEGLRQRLAEADLSISTLHAESRQAAAASATELAARERHVEMLERDRDSATKVLAEARAALTRVAEESQGRHEHLQFSMSELERLRNMRLVRFAERLSALRRKPRVSRLRRVVGAWCARGIREILAQISGTAEPPPLVGALSSMPAAVPSFPAGRYDVVVLSIIDWDFRFQRPQQIATQYARHGHRVFYLSTSRFLLGEEPDWALVRKIERVAELQIRSARMLDIYGGDLGPTDLEVLVAAFASLARTWAIEDVVCLVHAPFWWPLALVLRERLGWRVVYDCMDEWTNFPGFTAAVLALEHELVREADLTVVSAGLLLEKWRLAARRLVPVPNGVDLTHYRTFYRDNAVLADERRPIIGYFGALAKWVDVPLVEKIAQSYPEATIVLAGGHFDVDLSPLTRLANVRLLGQRPYEQMPQLLWHFDVCVIPFVVNDITEATNPVKFYEYLFGGKPIVAPELTELKPFARVAYLASNHSEFVEQVGRALTEAPDDPRREERRNLAQANDWSERYRSMDEAVRGTFPLVSVVIVTYGGLELTRACLDSLRNVETWPHLEIIVVDNASSDETPAYLRSVAAQDSRVRCLYNPANLGFPAANNLGIGLARGPIIVLLNNDTEVPPGLLGRLVRHLAADASIGLICPTTNFCGNEARVQPDYTERSGLPAFAAARAREFAGQAFEIPVAAMYCVAARSEVFREIGPLDEEFGIGLFEDDDFSLRVRKAGYRVVCASDAYVHHVGQASFRRLSTDEYSALWNRNQTHFETKWGISWTPHRPPADVPPAVSRIGLPDRPADTL